MISSIIKVLHKERETVKETKVSQITSMRLVEIYINTGKELIKYKYNYGTWYKFENNIQVIKGDGYSYDDFLQQVFHQHPLHSVKSFNLKDITK